MPYSPSSSSSSTHERTPLPSFREVLLRLASRKASKSALADLSPGRELIVAIAIGDTAVRTLEAACALEILSIGRPESNQDLALSGTDSLDFVHDWMAENRLWWAHSRFVIPTSSPTLSGFWAFRGKERVHRLLGELLLVCSGNSAEIT